MPDQHSGNSYNFSVWNTEGKNKKLASQVDKMSLKLKQTEKDTKSLREEVAHMTRMYTHFSRTLHENVGKYENIHIHYDDPRSRARSVDEVVGTLQEEVRVLAASMKTEHSVIEDTQGENKGNIDKLLQLIESLKSKEEADVRTALNEVGTLAEKVQGFMQIAKSEMGKKAMKLTVLVPANRYVIPF